MIDWTLVKKEHVKEACRRYDAGEELPRQPARNTFLLFEGKLYPAKFIRGLAYKITTGKKLNPSIDYSGGADTVRFFKKLGFSSEYKGKIVKGNQSSSKKERKDEPLTPEVMKNNIEIIKNIERLGERYCKKYLDIWDKDKLEKNWWYALDFFFSHSFMRGRRDELSNEYHQFTISALEDYFSIKSLALDISFKKLKKHKKFFDKEVILDFKRRKNILSSNSVRDADFEKEVSLKNPIINALLNKKKIEIKWDNGRYNKKIHLGNDKDIMMVLDVLNFITSDNRRMNFYFYLKDIIVKSGMKKAYEELTNIYAIGDKIAAFTIRDIGIMNPDIIKNDYQFAFPVDTWVLRISYKLGYRIDSIEKVKNFFIEKCKEYNISPLKCNAGLWYLGFHSLDILLKDCLIKIEV